MGRADPTTVGASNRLGSQGACPRAVHCQGRPAATTTPVRGPIGGPALTHTPRAHAGAGLGCHLMEGGRCGSGAKEAEGAQGPEEPRVRLRAQPRAGGSGEVGEDAITPDTIVVNISASAGQ